MPWHPDSTQPTTQHEATCIWGISPPLGQTRKAKEGLGRTGFFGVPRKQNPARHSDSAASYAHTVATHDGPASCAVVPGRQLA